MQKELPNPEISRPYPIQKAINKYCRKNLLDELCVEFCWGTTSTPGELLLERLMLVIFAVTT